MTTVYLAIGHGTQPNGTFDPGAVHGPLVEHDLAAKVVEAAVAAFRRSGFHDFIAEDAGIDGHGDPDYRGSVIRANAARAAVVCEVHFNAGSTSAHGTEVLYYPTSVGGRALASAMQGTLVQAVGIDSRGIKGRSDLWLLKGTTGVAVIPEVAFVDGDATVIEDHPQLCVNAGEAIARSILGYLHRPYAAPDARRWYVYDHTHNRTAGVTHSFDEALAIVRHLRATGVTVIGVEYRHP